MTCGQSDCRNWPFALGSIGPGSNNTGQGRSAVTSVTTADHVICIGANVSGANVSTSCYIGEIFGVTSSGGTAVFINSNGKLGTTTSSRRFKEEIKPMDKSSEAVLALKPVTFRYKKELDSDGIPQFGLLAEDVEKVNPHLVVPDKEGKPYTVRYDAVNAMLLNEFFKEHRKNKGIRKDNRKAKIWNDGPRNNRERAGSANPNGERPARRSESVPWRT